ncbi:unnamed protein product [Linum trigynum]|uniref:Uncharacterized protein n=1 Tax=Linum trigynum TaxID=586398 RepID=A0AAV2CCB1_9ROSI
MHWALQQEYVEEKLHLPFLCSQVFTGDGSMKNGVTFARPSVTNLVRFLLVKSVQEKEEIPCLARHGCQEKRGFTFSVAGPDDLSGSLVSHASTHVSVANCCCQVDSRGSPHILQHQNCCSVFVVYLLH